MKEERVLMDPKLPSRRRPIVVVRDGEGGIVKVPTQRAWADLGLKQRIYGSLCCQCLSGERKENKTKVFDD